ncbi:MAG: hypothetical protein IJ593_10650 [Lachnospiraceae bacterium]|nr:hypothetical protein [Lachnospiraceae bacterium]
MKKLKLEEIKIGQQVEVEQLSDILDTWILIEEDHIGDNSGIIRFIGNEPNGESQRILESGKIIGCIYNDSETLSEE